MSSEEMVLWWDVENVTGIANVIKWESYWECQCWCKNNVVYFKCMDDWMVKVNVICLFHCWQCNVMHLFYQFKSIYHYLYHIAY